MLRRFLLPKAFGMRNDGYYWALAQKTPRLPRRGQTENNSEAVIFRQGWWHSLGTGDTSLHKVPLFRGRVGVAPQKKVGR